MRAHAIRQAAADEFDCIVAILGSIAVTEFDRKLRLVLDKVLIGDDQGFHEGSDALLQEIACTLDCISDSDTCGIRDLGSEQVARTHSHCVCLCVCVFVCAFVCVCVV